MSSKFTTFVTAAALSVAAFACSSTTVGSGVETDPSTETPDAGQAPVARSAQGEDSGSKKDPQPGEACTAGTKACNGSTPLSCDAGTWVSEAACSDATPVCDQGLCVACTAGQKQCVGSTPRVCNAGQWSYQSACGGTNSVCLDGSCVQCAPGQKRCTGNTPEVCGPNGTWQTEAACGGSTPTCESSTGTCVECVAGTKTCSGLNSMMCNAQNKWEKVETCSFVCADDGVCGVCQPNSYGCEAPPNSSGVAKTCNAKGQWYYSTSEYSPANDKRLACSTQCSNRAGLKVNDTSDTVTDQTSGRTWERHVKYVPGTGYINYADAVSYCASKAGGWRLPTLAEAQALQAPSCAFPDEAAFPTIAGTGNYVGVWTSDSMSVGSHIAYLSGPAPDTSLRNVICVK